MALVECPACNYSVSEEAAACPKCGQPLKASRKTEETTGLDALVVIGGIGLSALLGSWLYGSTNNGWPHFGQAAASSLTE